jgi:hypothetical protein
MQEHKTPLSRWSSLYRAPCHGRSFLCPAITATTLP